MSRFRDVAHGDGEELGLVLRALTAEAARLDAAVARRLGLSPMDLMALDELGRSEGLTPGQLAQRLDLTSGAVTALADRLERHGLLERVPHPHDRRSTFLRLNERAGALARGAYGELAAEATAHFATYTAPERALVLRYLHEAAALTARHAERQAALSRAARPARPRSSPAGGS